jgi:8-oxo-dGTP pyrophosphatase MutT (NUDIX family)
MNVKTDELEEIAKELRAIAAWGLTYAQGPHDVERYERVMAASARLTGLVDGRRSADEILHKYQTSYAYLSPMSGGEAAVFRGDKLLLIKRADDGLWAMPGGITDAGETLAQSAQRELWEEAGICGGVTQLLGIFDSRLWGSQTKVHFYHAVFRIEADDDVPHIGTEVTDAAYFGVDELPPMSPGHHLRIPHVFKQFYGRESIPYFDPVGAEGCV